MADKPILFSGPMVRALLDGRKSQTRRIVKPQPDHGVWPCYYSKTGYAHAAADGGCSCRPITCPYDAGGISADDYGYLWARETFRGSFDYGDLPPSKWPHADLQYASPIWYEADHGTPNAGDGDWTKARPGIHMPRWASRLTLRITDVRAQRLQEISEEDAMAEGAEPVLVPPDGGSCPHVEGFRDLWESINGADSWAANPWVWCLSFDVIRANVDTLK